MPKNSSGPTGPLLHLRGRCHLLLTQLLLRQGRAALSKLRPGRVWPLLQHGGGTQPGYLLGEHPASEQHCCTLPGARRTTALAPHPSPRRQACAQQQQQGVDGAWSKQPPPDGDKPHDDNPVDGGSTLLALPLTNKSVGANNNGDASSTACGSTAAGSDATTASTTALDRPVNGSDAPPASTTALDSPVDGSNAERE